MLYRVSLGQMPDVHEIYEIERKTVWRCADRRNIGIFITEGSCRFEIEGETLLLSAGDMRKKIRSYTDT